MFATIQPFNGLSRMRVCIYRSDNGRSKACVYDWERSNPPDDLYEKFHTLAKTVHNFEEQIFNFWNCPITISNGFTEFSNRIIRENNLRGRGYSFEVLRGRTLYRKTNLERILANGVVEFGPSIPENEPVFLFEGPDEEEFDFAPDTYEIFD